MLNYQTLVYVHILLMVFWLGTDIGVFIAGLQFMNAKLPLEQRRAAIGVGMIIDRYPRVCFAAMLPVGAQLAWLRGSLLISTHAMVILWLACIVWMAAVVAAMVLAGTPRAAPWQRIERVFQVAGVILIGGWGVALLASDPAVPGWLAGKMIAFGLICLFAMLLEHAFRPVLAAFTAISATGSTNVLETQLRRGMYWTYLWVLAIYAGVLVAGFLGTVKP